VIFYFVNYLVGAGLADPDTAFDPFAFVAEPTDNLPGRNGVDVLILLVGILDCESSLLLSDKFDPCLDPLLLKGREFGFEFPRDPPGVNPLLLMCFTLFRYFSTF
jgi:hypothetical protein